AQGPRRSGGCPSRLDQHAAGMSPPLLGDPTMVCWTWSRLPDARIETEITHELLRLDEAVDVADRCGDGERHDHVDAGDRHQPCDVLVRKSRASQLTLDDRQIPPEPIEFAQMPFDSKAFVLRQDLFTEPSPSFGAAHVRGWTRRDQMRMQDRLDDVLQSRALAHDLIAAGDLPPERLRRLVGDPHFRKEAAGVELRQDPGVDRVRLDFGVRDHSHLDGIGDHDPLHMGADHARDRRGIARRLDDDNIFARQGYSKRRKQIASHVNAAEPAEFAVLPGDGLGKSPVYIKANDAHAFLLDWLVNKNGSWRATRHLLIRAHSASGKVARGGHVTSSGSQPNVYRRPARTFVLPAPASQMGSP